jgi:CRISPR-associated protein Cas2
MSRQPVIIAYDIVCDKRRRRVFRCLRKWRLDGQYSLIECRLTQPEANELFLQLVELINEQEDCLLLAWMDQKRESRPITRCARIGFRAPTLYVG